WDAAFVDWIDANADRLLALDSDALGYALHLGCGVKAEVVSRDEREDDLRAILNLGHTIGHALEAVAGYGELTHGEAISIGMVGAARIGVELGAPAEVYATTKRVLAKCGLPVRLPAHLDTDAIMGAMMHDKKFKEGSIVYVVPTAIGKVVIDKNMSAERVRRVVDQLKEEDEA